MVKMYTNGFPKKNFFDPPSVTIRFYYISSVHNQLLGDKAIRTLFLDSFYYSASVLHLESN